MITENQKTIIPVNKYDEKTPESKKIRRWFVYKFNTASPYDSTYACRLCEKYFTKFKLSDKSNKKMQRRRSRNAEKNKEK